MLTYFILFTTIGVLISIATKNETNAFVAIIIIGILWGVSHAPIWGLVSFGEMAFGVLAYRLYESKSPGS